MGLYLERNAVNAKCHLEILDNFVWPTVSGWDNFDKLILMQDASPLFAVNVRA